MPHPISLDQQLSSLSIDTGKDVVPVTAEDKNSDKFDSVPTSSVLVTPTKSVASASGADSSFEDEQDEVVDVQSKSSSTTVVKLLSKTEHKIMEEKGLMANEPLLKENPHRFVIFPIQDNDVSRADSFSASC